MQFSPVHAIQSRYYCDTRNYVSSTVNPFVGTPDRLISVTLYSPIRIPVSIASIPQQRLEDIKLSFESVSHSPPILPEIRVAEFKGSVSFDHALHSLEGSYNIVLNLTALDSVTYAAVTIEVIGESEIFSCCQHVVLSSLILTSTEV